jgi:TRAP-type C4-dicarboxylate transport system, large permease component
MLQPAIALAVMLVILVLGSIFLKKVPMAALLIIAAVAGALSGGFGVPLRQLVEGSQLFLNLILTVATAMLFMSVLKENGALDALTRIIVKAFYRSPSALLIFLMILVMLPAMLSGSAPASVLSTGILVAPILMKIGIPALETTAIIALGSMYGMIAPPINIPAMLIATGVYMPYEGFTLPLLILTFPLAIFSVLYLGRRYVKKIDRDEILAGIPEPEVNKFLVHVPLVFVLLYLILKSEFPEIDGGTPLVFAIGTLIALFTGKRIRFFTIAKNSMRDSLDVIALFAAVGCFIQITALTGARGLLVLGSLSVTGVLLYIVLAIANPAIGGLLMPFGAAGVLGIPLVMAFQAHNTIWITSALTLLMGVGALLPPTAVSGLFSAQVVLKNDSYLPVIKKSWLPILLTVVVGVAALAIC